METVILTLLPGAGYAAGTVARGEVAITSDDRPPLPTLSIANASTTEGNSGVRDLAFTITLSAAQAVPVSVSWSTANGTALAGSDFSPRSGQVVFAPGQI